MRRGREGGGWERQEVREGAGGGGVWVAGAERGGGSEGKLIADLSGSGGCSGERGAGCWRDAQREEASDGRRTLSRADGAAWSRAWRAGVQSLGTFGKLFVRARGAPEVAAGKRPAASLQPKGTLERPARRG